MQRQGQIQSWTPGALWTKKRKGNSSQQPQEQRIKSPQSTWCTLHLWNTWIEKESSQNWGSDFGSNCRLGVCFLHLLCFWFYVYLSLVFTAYYHWHICLLGWLLSLFSVYIFFFPFSLFVSVYVYASLCDFVYIALLLPFVLGFCQSFLGFFGIVFSTCYHC